jgi:hypothetical protein
MVVLATEAEKVSVEDATSLDRAVPFQETPEANQAVIVDLTGSFR